MRISVNSVISLLSSSWLHSWEVSITTMLIHCGEAFRPSRLPAIRSHPPSLLQWCLCYTVGRTSLLEHALLHNLLPADIIRLLLQTAVDREYGYWGPVIALLMRFVPDRVVRIQGEPSGECYSFLERVFASSSEASGGTFRGRLRILDFSPCLPSKCMVALALVGMCHILGVRKSNAY